MKWNPKDPYYIESTCGHYRISKSHVRGVAKYTPWIRTGRVDKDGNWWGKYSLDVCDSLDEAKSLINQEENSNAESIQEREFHRNRRTQERA